MKLVVMLRAVACVVVLGVGAVGRADANSSNGKADQAAGADEPTPAAAAKADDEKSDSKANGEKPADKDAAEKAAGKAQDAADDAEKEKQESKPKADEKPSQGEKRKTYTVEPKRLRIDLSLDGTFVANKMTEVPLRPDSWSDYEIVEVAPLGAKVHKGETLFKFDSKKLNEAIDDLELEQRLNELAIMRSEEELPRQEQTLKLDFEGAERADRQAQEDSKRYHDIDRPMTVRTAEFMLKFYKFNLEYEKDELEQLEKMYKADDLTEETEEIVLKRQRSSVEFAEFSLERAKLGTDEMLNITLPRMDIQIKESLERAALAKARAQLALSLDLTRTRYELEQRKAARAKSLDKHAKLLADRELMELKSPADGVVYYGQCVNGRFADMNSLANKYQPHNNVSGGAILLTIVDERPLAVTAMLDEANRPEVSAGQSVRVILPAEASERVDGKVKLVSPIPVSSGKFEIQFEVDQDEVPEWIVAGIGCKIGLTTYDKPGAITVPKKAVHDDDSDPEKHYVWLVNRDDDDAKPQRREVTLGKSKGDDIEIRKGLQKGDVISLDDEDQKAQQGGQPADKG